MAALCVLLPTEKERCEFRRDHCYDAFGGKSQVCSRPFDQLLKDVRPAELVRTEGVIYRADDKVYLEDKEAAGKGALVEILPSSCDLSEVRPLCDELAGAKAGVVGAYYTDDAPEPVAGRSVKGRILVLEFTPDDFRNPPVE